MKIFLDTSSLFKLYHKESGTPELMDEKVALTLIEAFEKDSENFNIVSETNEIRKLAKKLIRKYCKEGLRTLDSIQLASVLMIRDKVDFFFTSDNLLAEIARLEKIKVK